MPRWIPKLSRLRGATQGMKFNLKRALVKDYGTIVNAFVIMVLLEMLEHEPGSPETSQNNTIMCISGIVIVIVIGLSVRIAKKRKILVVS